MSAKKTNPTPKSVIRILTEREADVFRLAVAGQQNAGIAENLGISVKTVEAHKRSIFIKLGVNSHVKLISKYAQRYAKKKL